MWRDEHLHVCSNFTAYDFCAICLVVLHVSQKQSMSFVIDDDGSTVVNIVVEGSIPLEDEGRL